MCAVDSVLQHDGDGHAVVRARGGVRPLGRGAGPAHRHLRVQARAGLLRREGLAPAVRGQLEANANSGLMHIPPSLSIDIHRGQLEANANSGLMHIPLSLSIHIYRGRNGRKASALLL